MPKDRPYPIWLGSWDVKERRIEALKSLSLEWAAGKQSGGSTETKPNISKLIQMIADGELELIKR